MCQIRHCVSRVETHSFALKSREDVLKGRKLLRMFAVFVGRENFVARSHNGRPDSASFPTVSHEHRGDALEISSQRNFAKVLKR